MTFEDSVQFLKTYFTGKLACYCNRRQRRLVAREMTSVVSAFSLSGGAGQPLGSIVFVCWSEIGHALDKSMNFGEFEALLKCLRNKRLARRL